MMNDILIVEDNPLEKIKLKAMLKGLGYTNIHVVSSLKQVQEFIETTKPALIVADVFLHGETSLEIITNTSAASIPILFITASKDKALYDSIENSYLYGYLIKPIDPITLHATINLLTYKQKSTESISAALFIKQGSKEYKTPYADIIWLEAEGNYTFIYSLSGKQAIKKSLRRVIEDLDERFAQCHKKYCVNLQYVTSFRRDAVRVNDQEIPMTYFYKKDLLKKLHTLKSVNN